MKLSKKEALEKLPHLSEEIGKKHSDFVHIEVLSEKQFKSQKQNNLFHGLLECFWKSHCHSYQSWDSMRNYYKALAGLIKQERVVTFKDTYRLKLYRAIKSIKVDKGEEDEFDKAVFLLKGFQATVGSWADADKETAKFTIDRLIEDMSLAGVSGSSQGLKFEEILKTLHENSQALFNQRQKE